MFVPENHISVDHFASDGVYISTPEVSPSSALVKTEVHLTLARPGKAMVLEQIVFSPDGEQVASVRKRLRKDATGADLSLHIAGECKERKECEEYKLTFVFHHR